MKTRHLFGIISAVAMFCGILLLSGCEQNQGRKITGQKEYILTVASKMLPGVGSGCGTNVLTDVYAVKKEGSKEWEQQTGIAGFDYEIGYEYKIKINETSYLDYSMGEPAWTEYKLLEIISKEKKDSEGLPEHFIPEWYYKDENFVPAYRYAVDAAQKEMIEKDLKENPPVPAAYNVMFYGSDRKWIMIDTEHEMVATGYMKTISKDFTEYPDSYRLLPPEGSILGSGEVTFIANQGYDITIPPYDGFINNRTTLLLYKDVTQYYRNKYPDAGVNTVVYSIGIHFDGTPLS